MMAKHFVSFIELMSANGKWVPPTSPGHHHVTHFATVVLQEDKIVVVGSREGRVTLKLGDTLGYNFGQVWMVPNPETMKDPIRRLLGEEKISQRVLEYSDNPVTWIDQKGRSFPSCADTPEGNLKPLVLGEAVHNLIRDVTEDDFFEKLRGAKVINTGHRWIMETSGGDAVIVRSISRKDDLPSSRVSRIVVRSNADRNVVAEWLKSLF